MMSSSSRPGRSMGGRVQRSSRAGYGGRNRGSENKFFDFPHPRIDLRDARSIFNNVFAGEDPFNDMVCPETMRSNWDVKTTKMKKADGTVIIERTCGRTGRVEREIQGNTGSCGPTARTRSDYSTRSERNGERNDINTHRRSSSPKDPQLRDLHPTIPKTRTDPRPAPETSRKNAFVGWSSN